MVRLINADRLEDDCNLYDKWDAQIVKEWLKDQPTVDAVPVIRCKDCKYYKVYELFNHTLPLCDRIKTTMVGALEEDDYCSRAERKEE